MENKMADESISPVVVVSSPAPAEVETVKKVVKAKNPKAKPSHPNTADMVDAAIKTLAERNGSSLQAIKKYMAGTYKLDTTKHALFIKKYLKSAVTAGTLVQTKGKGANGSFKLAVKAEATKGKSKPKATAAKKVGSPKGAAVKKPAAKKTDTAKAKPKKEAAPKKAAVKKVTVEKKAAKPRVVKSKSPKAKKISKVPTAKPKAPKPKKAIAPKAKTVAQKV